MDERLDRAVAAFLAELDHQYEMEQGGPYVFDRADPTCISIEGTMDLVRAIQAALIAAGAEP